MCEFKFNCRTTGDNNYGKPVWELKHLIKLNNINYNIISILYKIFDTGSTANVL